jgi:hypothetical protein
LKKAVSCKDCFSKDVVFFLNPNNIVSLLQIHYVSESVASLLGHVPTDLTKTTIYDITMEEDKKLLYGLLQSYNGDEEQRTELVVHFKRSTIVMQEEVITTIVCFSTFYLIQPSNASIRLSPT